MIKDVARVLDDLSHVSEALNQASDLLSKHILEVEFALQRYRLGVPAWVSLCYWDVPDTNPVVTRVQCLGYDKLKGKWGLLVSEGFDDEPPSEEAMRFLREMPREIKSQAADKLPELLAKLLENATNVASETIDKQAVAQEIVRGLKRGNK
jgi:hypothetical protein